MVYIIFYNSLSLSYYNSLVAASSEHSLSKSANSSQSRLVEDKEDHEESNPQQSAPQEEIKDLQMQTFCTSGFLGMVRGWKLRTGWWSPGSVPRTRMRSMILQIPSKFYSFLDDSGTQFSFVVQEFVAKDQAARCYAFPEPSLGPPILFTNYNFQSYVVQFWHTEVWAVFCRLWSTM